MEYWEQGPTYSKIPLAIRWKQQKPSQLTNVCIYQLCAKNTCDCANCVLGIKLVAVVEWKAINFKSTAACLAHLAE